MKKDVHIVARCSYSQRKELKHMAIKLGVSLSDLMLNGAFNEAKKLLRKQNAYEKANDKME